MLIARAHREVVRAKGGGLGGSGRRSCGGGSSTCAVSAERLRRLLRRLLLGRLRKRGEATFEEGAVVGGSEHGARIK